MPANKKKLWGGCGGADGEENFLVKLRFTWCLLTLAAHQGHLESCDAPATPRPSDCCHPGNLNVSKILQIIPAKVKNYCSQ